MGVCGWLANVLRVHVAGGMHRVKSACFSLHDEATRKNAMNPARQSFRRSELLTAKRPALSQSIRNVT